MNHVYLLPIEPMPTRYSVEWLGWFKSAMGQQGIPYTVVDPNVAQTDQGAAAFSSPFVACEYRARQLAELSRLLAVHPASSSPVVFAMDGWFPGIESIAMLRDLGGLKIKLVGIFHGGLWDDHDFLQGKVGEWANKFEQSALEAFDTIILASEHHRLMIYNQDMGDEQKTKVVRFPVMEPPAPNATAKEKIVLWPHRISAEKNPQLFTTLEKLFREKYADQVKFIRTRDVCATKGDYHALLERAKVCVSTAEQETFGISMLEAANFGCAPICPNDLSYPEFIEPRFLYDGLAQAVDLIAKYLNEPANPRPYAGSTSLEWLSEVLC